MGILQFKVEADYQEVVRLRAEVERLEKEMRSINSNDTLKMKGLEGQLAQARTKMQSLTSAAAQSGYELQKAYSGVNLGGVQKSLDGILGGVKHVGNVANGVISNVQTGLGAVMGMGFGAGIGAIVNKLFRVRSMFQDVESSMSVFLKSEEKATDFVNRLQDYAWYNMFEFSELSQASQQMLAYGNTVDEILGEGDGRGGMLDRLSNIASGTNKSLMQFVEMYNRAKSIGYVDSRSQQTWASSGVVLKDILKEAGVEATGTKVKFEDLNTAIEYMTNEGGMFYGLMDAKMQNLSASYGQLQDDIDIMFNELGKSSEGFIKKGIDGIDSLVANYEVLGEVLARLVATYGAVKVVSATGKYMQKKDNIFNKLQGEADTEVNKDYIERVKGYLKQKADDEMSAEVLENDGTITQEIADKYKAKKQAIDAVNISYAEALAYEKNELTALDEQIIKKQEYLDVTRKYSDELKSTETGALDRMKELEGESETVKHISEAYSEMQRGIMEGDDERVESAGERIEFLKEQGIAEGDAAKITEYLDVKEKQEFATKQLQTNAIIMNTTEEEINTLETQRNAAAQTMNSGATTTATLKDKAHTLIIRMKTQAQNSLNAAMAANPIGLVITAITTLIGVTSSIIHLVRGFNKEEDYAAQAQEVFTEKVVDTTAKIDMYLDILEKANSETPEYKNAQKELIKIYNDTGVSIDYEGDMLEQLNSKRQAAIELIRQEAIEKRKAGIQSGASKAREDERESLLKDLGKGRFMSQWGKTTKVTTKNSDGTINELVGTELEGTANFNFSKDDKRRIRETASSIISANISEIENATDEEFDTLMTSIGQMIDRAVKNQGIDTTGTISAGDRNGEVEFDFGKYYANILKAFRKGIAKVNEKARVSMEATEAATEAMTTQPSSELEKQVYELQAAKEDTSRTFEQTLNDMFTENGKNIARYVTLSDEYKETHYDVGEELLQNSLDAANTAEGIHEFVSKLQEAIKTLPMGNLALVYANELMDKAKSKEAQITKTIHDIEADGVKAQSLAIKRAETIEKNQRQRNKDRYEGEYDSQKAILDLMKDGIMKETKMRKLEYERELHDIHESKHDMIEAEKDRQRALFDANEAIKEQNASAAGTKYVRKNWLESMYDATYENEVINPLIERKTEEAAKRRFKDLIDLTDEYQTERQKKDEERRKVEEDIRAIEAEIAELSSDGNEEAVTMMRERLRLAKEIAKQTGFDQERNDFFKQYGTLEERKKAINEDYDNKIALERVGNNNTYKIQSLEKERQEALSKAELDDLSERINFAKALDEVGTSLSDLSAQTLKAAEAFMQSAEFAKMGAEEQKEYYEIVKELRQSQGYSFKDMFPGLSASADNVRAKENAYRIAQAAYGNIGENASDDERRFARLNLEQSEKELNEATDEYIEESVRSQGALGKFSEAIDNISSGSLLDFARGIDSLLAMAGVGEKDGVKASSALQGALGVAAPEVEAAVVAAQASFKMWDSFTGGAISDAMGSVKLSLTNFMRGIFDRNNLAYERLAEKIGRLTDALEKAREYLNEDFDDSYGKTAIETEEKIQENLAKQRASVYELAMKYEKTRDARKGHRENGFKFDDYSELFSMSGEELKEFISENHDIYSKLTEEEKNFIQQLIDIEDESVEATDRLHEKLKGISKEDFTSNLIESLYDLDATTEQIADNMEANLFRAFLNTRLDEMDYAGKADKLYKRYTKGEIDTEKFKQEYRALIDAGIDARDEIAELTGYANDYYKQEGSSRGFQAMSQGTADVLEGRFSAMQVALEEVKAAAVPALLPLNTNITEMLGRQSQTYACIAQTQDMLAQSLVSIQSIDTNILWLREQMTKKQGVFADIEATAKNTKGLVK